MTRKHELKLSLSFSRDLKPDNLLLDEKGLSSFKLKLTFS